MSEGTQSGNPLVQASMNYFETETKDKHDMSSTGIEDKIWASFNVNGLLTVHKRAWNLTLYD